MGYLVQMAGLAVQNFVSAAVGIAVAVALVRGFARKKTDQLGNFWVDLIRIALRVLLPICRASSRSCSSPPAWCRTCTATGRSPRWPGRPSTITGGPVA